MTLADRIIFSNDPQTDLATAISRKEYSHVGILADENTLVNCLPKVREAFENPAVIEVPAGEQNKNLNTCSLIWEALTKYRFDRHSLLVILGGGVLGDMGGFCASTFKRGIDFILVPTTLLAQVDASIGGKLGIDFKNYKNHIGLFNEPVLTLVAPVFLNTLPERELKSGFAEVIKHCLSSDPNMWETLQKKQLHLQDWDTLIRHSIAFKAHVVAQDPYENGLRKVLNVGHTVGHAIETAFLASGRPITHGEAVAHGILLESVISNQKGMLDDAALEEISDFITRVYGYMKLTEAMNLIGIMRQDKKNKGNTIRMALIERIGRVKWDVEVSEKEIEASFAYYHSL